MRKSDIGGGLGETRGRARKRHAGAGHSQPPSPRRLAASRTGFYTTTTHRVLTCRRLPCVGRRAPCECQQRLPLPSLPARLAARRPAARCATRAGLTRLALAGGTRCAPPRLVTSPGWLWGLTSNARPDHSLCHPPGPRDRGRRLRPVCHMRRRWLETGGRGGRRGSEPGCGDCIPSVGCDATAGGGGRDAAVRL